MIMIVHRVTYRGKPGRMNEVVQMISDAGKASGFRGTYRVYTPSFGPQHQVCLELEFADLAECEKFWNEWWKLPTTPAHMKKWNELVESGGTSEIWVLRT